MFLCLTVPAPTSVTVTNGSVNVGSTVTLTCTVELSPAVDVPVTVNTVWTGPDGFMTTNTAQTVIGSTTTYTSTTIVSRERSGNYTCTATVAPNSASTYLAGSGVMSNTTSIVARKFQSFMFSRCCRFLLTEICPLYSCSSSSQCTSHSVQCLCPSGGQLESSI